MFKGWSKTLVRHIDMHIFRFFVDSFGWPMMYYKVSPIDSIWSSSRHLQSNYGKLMPMDFQSYLLRSLIMFHIAQFGAMMRWGWWRMRSLSMLDYPNMWNSGNKAWNKVQLMWWKWVRMWITKRMFYYICQNLYLFKGPLFWKVFGLATIGSWIM